MSARVPQWSRRWLAAVGWAAGGLALGVLILNLAMFSYGFSVVILRLFGPLNTEGLALDVGKSALGTLVVCGLSVLLALIATRRAAIPGWTWIAAAVPSLQELGYFAAAHALSLVALSGVLGLLAAWGFVSWRTGRFSA